MTAAEVDEAWRALLEETLPPDKQEALMETYQEESDPQVRYNMLLEFSSYLRQGAGNDSRGGDENDPDDKYRPKPRMRQGFDDDDDANLCWEIMRVLLIVAVILAVVVGGTMWLNSSVGGGPAALVSSNGGPAATAVDVDDEDA